MAVYRKGYMHLSGLRLYVCFPFFTSVPTEEFQRIIMEVYSYGVVPIIAATYSVRQNFHVLDRHNIYATIALCEGVLLLEEEHLTRTMMSELHYARKCGLPVYKIGE